MIFGEILLLFIYLEVVYHIACFGLTGVNPLLSLGLILCVTGAESFLVSFFRKKTRKILLRIFKIIVILIYAVQLVYLKIFKQPLLLSAAIHAGGDALVNYWKETLYGIFRSAIPIIFMFGSLLLLVICQNIYRKKRKKRKKRSKKQRLYLRGGYLAGCVLGILIFNLVMFFGKSSVSLYRDFSEPLAVFRKYGVTAGIQRNIQEMLFDTKSEEVFQELENLDEDAENPEGKEDPVETKNVLPIDFQALLQSEERDAVKSLHQYVERRTPTNKNEYTGMFEGYNLIYMTAEGFSPYCVDENITPTLYKLVNSGFQFKNYYVPLWQTSTSDGEFTNCTGLLPDKQFSFRRSAENAMPFLLPGFFAAEGVQSWGYHNNSLSYYDRYKTHENMGYLFKAANLGKLSEEEWGTHIFEMEHPKEWPQSDLEMMQATLGDYVNQPRFHAYYMTVSGHLQYTFAGNKMAAKNRDVVENLPYSERAKAYVACNVEFDRALAWLIQELENAGKLENTVICFGADHYPYGLEKKEIEELRGAPLEKKRDIYQSNLILWNSAMEPVVIEKPCSAVDILPTLLNLFGFPYDSRLYCGQDILSDNNPLVIFSDRSFLTERIYYNAETGEAESLNEEAVDVDYVERMKAQVKDSFTFSAGILDYDYYKTLEQYIPKKE